MAHISDFLSTVHGHLGGVRAARNVYADRFAPGFHVLLEGLYLKVRRLVRE